MHSWTWVTSQAAQSAIDFLHQHGAICAVQGQLLTREGLTLTEDPEVFQLLGVYVVATGQLHAKVEPASGPVTVALGDNETTVHPAAYR